MQPRTVVSAGLCLVALALPRAGRAADPPARGKGYDSPRAAFDAARAALKKDDYKAFYHCLTPEAGELLAGHLAFAGVMARYLATLDPSGRAAQQAHCL